MPNDPGAWVILFVAALFFLATFSPPSRPGVAVSLGLAVHAGGLTFYGVTRMDMKRNQRVTLTITPIDADKLPAVVTNPQWAASAPGLVAAADGLSAVFTPADNGDVVFTVQAVAADGTTLSDSATVSVIAGVAVALGLTVGTPEPIPATV